MSEVRSAVTTATLGGGPTWTAPDERVVLRHLVAAQVHRARGTNASRASGRVRERVGVLAGVHPHDLARASRRRRGARTAGRASGRSAHRHRQRDRVALVHRTGGASESRERRVAQRTVGEQGRVDGHVARARGGGNGLRRVAHRLAAPSPSAPPRVRPRGAAATPCERRPSCEIRRGAPLRPFALWLRPISRRHEPDSARPSNATTQGTAGRSERSGRRRGSSTPRSCAFAASTLARAVDREHDSESSCVTDDAGRPEAAMPTSTGEPWPPNSHARPLRRRRTSAGQISAEQGKLHEPIAISPSAISHAVSERAAPGG